MSQMAWLMHQQVCPRAVSGLSGDLMALQTHIMRRAMGVPSEDVITPNADDARFADPVCWTDSATWDIIKVVSRLTHRLKAYFRDAGLVRPRAAPGRLLVAQLANLVAPTNYFWLNPVAMQRFVETNGESASRAGRTCSVTSRRRTS